ncbi:hypothetical protein ACFLIM_33475 [Nonomuraea sp. M3C6]|uniref:Uncharacterized protein n=1 Tax=Nonomuraea marmarensis TaxID=3351344 RepID=A0ABW7ALB9_9ACTN
MIVALVVAALALRSEVIDAPRDAELAPLMRARGIAVPEELVAERPFDDLAG